MHIPEEKRLVSATMRGNPLPVSDDDEGPLWVFFGEFGPAVIVRAKGFELAWGMAVDSMPTIPEADIPDAYGAWDAFAEWLCKNHGIEPVGGTADWKRVVRFVTEYLPQFFQVTGTHPREDGTFPQLEEGYTYQDHAVGTGIVFLGHSARLVRGNAELFEEWGIQVALEDKD